jgi:hypothetical protein
VLGCVGLLEAASAVDFTHITGSAAQAMQDVQPGRVREGAEKSGHTVQLALVGSTHGNCSSFVLLPNSNISATNL